MLMTRLAIATYDFGRIPVDETAEAEERQHNLSLLTRTREEFSLIWFALTFFFKPSAIHIKMTKADQVQTLLTLRFITNIKGSVMFASACLLPVVVLVIVVCLLVPPFAHGCTGCATNNLATAITIACLGSLGLLNAVVFTVKCRAFPDAWGVFQEGRLSARGVVVALLGFLLLCFLQVPYQYLFTIMMGFGFTFGLTVVTGYQVYLASKNETATYINHRRHQVSSKNKSSVVESGSNPNGPSPSPVQDLKYQKLNDVLCSPALTRAFEYHLSTEFGGENLCFLQDVYDWMATYDDIPRTAAAARARKLINTYISDRGFYQINISSEMAKPLLELVNVDPESIRRDSFDPVRNEIAGLLEAGAVPRFLSSREYSSLISGDVVVQNMT